MKSRMLLLLCVVLLGVFLSLAFIHITDIQAKPLVPNQLWEQVNHNGFGDILNKQIPSLAVFGDYIYAGVWHSDTLSQKAQIWRSSNGVDWAKVDDRETNGTVALLAYDGFLYAGSWDTRIWRSSDGVAWTDVITDKFGSTNGGIARFAVFSDTLYASTWNGTDGTEIWKTNNGVHWDPFVQHGLTHDPYNNGAIASEVFNNELYWGVGNPNTGAQLWRTDGLTTTAIITDGFGTTHNDMISSLAAFGGYLYAGLKNDQGGEVWRSSNGTEWTRVYKSQNPDTNKDNALEVFSEHLYLIIQNDVTGLEVWRTPNGTTWEQVGFDGFGDIYNRNSNADNSATVFNNQLYIGVTNFPTGGQMWRMNLQYKLFLPISTIN